MACSVANCHRQAHPPTRAATDRAIAMTRIIVTPSQERSKHFHTVLGTSGSKSLVNVFDLSVLLAPTRKPIQEMGGGRNDQGRTWSGQPQPSASGPTNSTVAYFLFLF